MNQWTEEELLDREFDAIIIQRFWKLRKYRKAARQVVKSLREPFYYFFSPISINMRATTNTLKLMNVVKTRKIPYFAFNLCDNPMVQSWVKEQKLNQDLLPYIFIHNIYIGSMDELQILIDHKYLDQILKKEYLQKCLVCDTQRPSEEQLECDKCKTPYVFFQKKNKGVIICPKCRQQQTEDVKECSICNVECIRINEALMHLKEIQ